MTVRLKEKLLIPFREDLSETLDQRLQVGSVGVVGFVILGYLSLAAFNLARSAEWPGHLWHSL